MTGLERLTVVALVAIAISSLGGCANAPIVATGPVMSADVSSSGRYAITAHRDNELRLWDLKEHSQSLISDQVNVYSAYFVDDRRVFIWQDLDNRVHVQNVAGDSLKSFDLPVPTYGHLMDGELEDYYYSTRGWGVHYRSETGAFKTLKADDGKAFIGYNKLLNLSIDDAGEYLLSAGWGEPKGFEKPYYGNLESFRGEGGDYRTLNHVALWDLEKGEPVAKFDGNTSKLHAVISADGKWVISSDESYGGFFWSTEEPGARRRLASYSSGLYLDKSGLDITDPGNWDDSQLIDPPKGVESRTLAVAFIDNSDYYLRFGNQSHITALFKAGNPWPQKYFDLGEDPRLVTYGSHYSRNTAIATSPETGVLVMGHDEGGGISVYQYDKQRQTLDRTWVVD